MGKQSEVSFLQLFEQSVSQYPERVALAGDAPNLTYKTLDHQSKVIAAHLQARGVQPGAVVAIYTEARGLAIASMIAVLRSGCAYLPLDPVYPLERLQYMVRNAETRLVICDNHAFESPLVERLDLRDLDFAADNSAHQPVAVIEPSMDAYIIYTSGSTGRPKGVRMCHGTLNNLIHWQNEHYQAGETYRTLQFSSLSFDVSFQEIFATFAQAGTLFLVSNNIKQDFRELLSFIERHGIERIFLPYIALLQLLQWANRLQIYPQTLREIITAGEQLVISDDVKKAFRGLKNVRLSNQYGPSESHVVTEYFMPDDIDAWVAIPPIGKPINRAQIWLLDEQLQPVADGEVGELFIAGPVLANGYINNAEETTKRFVDLVLNGNLCKAYRTGDLALRDSEHNIFYKGRIDGQVKISGYRVELSEVEAALLNTGLVEEAAVAVRELRGNKSLVAFLRVKSPEHFTLDLLRARLAIDLPAYMRPSEYHLLAQLVKTATGKIDRKTMVDALSQELDALKQEVDTLKQGVDALSQESKSLSPEVELLTATRLPVAQQILSILRREINCPTARGSDNLLNLGMDSLAANRIAAALYDELSITVPAYALFQHRTIQRFVDYVTKHDAAEPAAMAVGRTEKAAVDAAVAIIGMAVNVPGARTLAQFWENLAGGKESLHFFADTISDTTADTIANIAADNLVNVRGVIQDPLGFDESFFDITPAEARFIDPQQRVLLELASHALENAGYVPDQFPGRIGIFCGTGNNTYYLNHVLKNPEQLEAFSPFQAMIANEKDYCATRVAYKLNLVGPALSVHSACSTSLVAVCNAVDAIRSGQCDMAIAGGAAVTFPQQQTHEYQEGSIYSRDGHTRTFDKDSTGTVFSDGGGLVVLKRLDYALADGDHIYAAISGVAVNNDGAGKASFSAPSIEGQKHVVQAAQRNAGVRAQDIGYLEAHGTATPMGDPIEVAALTAAFGSQTDAKQFCRLGSVKSNFGHLTAASGVVGLIKSALAIERDLIPPTINFSQPNPALDIENTPFVIAASPAAWQKPPAQRIAGVSSFGIGGTNAHAILQGVERRMGEVKPRRLPSWLPFCVSAHSANALSDYVASYRDFLRDFQLTGDRVEGDKLTGEKLENVNPKDVNPKDVNSDNRKITSTLLAAFLVKHRAVRQYRKAIAADVSKPTWALFDEAVRVNEAALVNKATRVNEPTLAVEHIVLAFPGQGSQVMHMGKALYLAVDAYREAFDRCCDILARNHHVDLHEILFGTNTELGETQHAQIALFCVCYSLYRVLTELEVPISACIGHSIGELVAAAVAEVFDLETGIRIVMTRGAAMQAQERGAMLAVREPAAALAKFVTAQVTIAAQNTPESCTLAGPHIAITTLCAALDAQNIKYKKLETSHGFHSAAMDGAKKIFADSLADVVLSAPRIPFISCVTGEWITAAQATDIHYWADQLRQPVRFYQGIEKLAAFSNLLVLECGPQRTVAGMVLQTLEQKSDLHLIHGLALAGQADGELTGFSQALGELWEHGVDLHWPPLDIDRHSPANHFLADLPLYPFQHSTHVIEPTPGSSGALAAIPADRTFEHTKMERTTMKNAIITQLEGLFSDISGMDLNAADRDASFFELGLDSLLLTQSTIKLKKQFKVQVTFRQLLNDCGSFNALADFLVEKGADLPVVSASPPHAGAVTQAGAATHAGAVPAVHTPGLVAAQFAGAQFLGAQLSGAQPVAVQPMAMLATAPDGNLMSLLQQQMQLLQGQLALLSAHAAGGNFTQMPSPLVSAVPSVPVSSATVSSAAGSSAAVSSATVSSLSPVANAAAPKPFGAGTRINVKRTNDMSPLQKTSLQQLSEKYNTQFKSSKKFAQDNRKQLADPRVVSGFRTTLKEIIYPIVVARSEGAYLWDIDGFRLIDITCGFGSNFFGNSAPFIKAAIAKQLDTGYEIGPQHPLIAEASQLFCEVTGNERVAFCNTGSEAVLGAVRLARTVTAKEKIVIFENDYHGINDEVIVTRGSNGLAVPAAAGIPDAAVANVIVLDYGDEKSLEYIVEHADDIAALLIEPVQSRYPELQPKEFLLKARKICTDKNIAFIFDEVITGFRIHSRGAQGYYGIDADICTYGKIVGGGLPIGVFAGKKEFMDALDGGGWQYGDSSAPEVGVTYFAGTFVRHPLVLAAAVAVLTKLKQEPHLQSWLNGRADRMVTEINDYAQLVGAPLKIANCGSMCKIKIPQDIAYEELIYVMLRQKGIHVWDARPTFITTAHSDEDIAFIITAFKSAIDDMLAMGFFPTLTVTAKPGVASSHKTVTPPVAGAKTTSPPVAGAKMGRDETGAAVWYVPSGSHPGQFVKWQG